MVKPASNKTGTTLPSVAGLFYGYEDLEDDFTAQDLKVYAQKDTGKGDNKDGAMSLNEFRWMLIEKTPYFKALRESKKPADQARFTQLTEAIFNDVLKSGVFTNSNGKMLIPYANTDPTGRNLKNSLAFLRTDIWYHRQTEDKGALKKIVAYLQAKGTTSADLKNKNNLLMGPTQLSNMLTKMGFGNKTVANNMAVSIVAQFKATGQTNPSGAMVIPKQTIYDFASQLLHTIDNEYTLRFDKDSWKNTAPKAPAKK